MDSFFNMVKTNIPVLNREQLIKQTILDTLSENAKEIQYELKEIDGDNIINELDLCDHTQTLCATIEALFLHGLKDSFFSQTFNVLSGGEVNRKPAPNFWSPLLLFSHKHSIEQIHSMAQITTEIGYCRCWVRQSLNDCLLSSYLANMRKSPQALAPYYQRTAFVRDRDFMELAESFLGGIEACVTFQLPLNSSLLNHWTDQPLQLSGIYSPPLRSCPIASGIDIANSFGFSESALPLDGQHSEQSAIPIPQPIQLNQCFASSIRNSPFRRMPDANIHQSTFMRPYNSVEVEADPDISVDIGIDCNQKVDDDDIEHDVRLNALLSRVDEITAAVETNEDSSNAAYNKEFVSNSENIAKDQNVSSQEVKESEKSENLKEEELPYGENIPVMGNLLTLNRGWSSTDDTEKNRNEEVQIRSTGELSPQAIASPVTRQTSIISNVDKTSFDMLLNKPKYTNALYSRQIDFKDVWERFESSIGVLSNTINASNTGKLEQKPADESTSSSTDSVNLGDFVLIDDVADSLLNKFTLNELQEMVQQTYRIPQEMGLDAQNFACLSCENPLGIGGAGLTTAQVCAFSGSYYCSNCMATDLHEIPARVINNWDFRKYPVCQKAAAFLYEFRYQAFIDMKLLNPDIYQFVDEMSELQSLRIQLNFIRAYLFTCCASIIENLQKQLWSKEYLYEHIHRYTLADLENIPRGVLAEQLRKVVSFGRNHILSCTLCSQKGYICEICQSNRILYPFDIDTTLKCDLCGSVFHAECLKSMQSCPKCRRKRIRQDSTNNE